MLHEDRSRAESFGADADRYDRSRPSYPPALIDAVVGPDPTALDIVDVGCGTGIAARLLAARGARVLGVEVDARMAELARARGIEVEVGAFETWDPKGRQFDRVTAGQAWHWVDPTAGPDHAAAMLRPGGKLMPFWNVASGSPEFRAAVAPVYERLAPNADSVSVQTGYRRATEHRGELEGIRACPALSDPTVERFGWNRTYTRDEWLDQLPTHSDHSGLPAEVLAPLLEAVGAAIDALGGSFEMRYETLLLSATKL